MCVYAFVFIILAEYGDICGLIWDHSHTGNNNNNQNDNNNKGNAELCQVFIMQSEHKGGSCACYTLEKGTLA